MPRRTTSLMLAPLAMIMLAACGGGGESVDPSAGSEVLANGVTVRAQIETRQEALKAIGKNFKTINDQLKSSSADVETIQTAVAELPDLSADMAEWFPAGTGPESGVETDALAIIWDDPVDFSAKIVDAQSAIAAFDLAAQSGDLDAITSAFQTTGGACKACHEKYRLDD